MKQTSPSSSKHLQQNKWCRQSGRPRYACGEMPTGTHADKTRNLPENHSKLDTKAAANSAEWPTANSLNLQKSMVYENGLSVTTRNGLETSRDPSDHEESSSGEVDECRLQGWENEGAASLGGFPKSGTCLTARHTNGNIDSGDQSNNPNIFAGPSTNGDRIMGDTSLWESHRTSDQPGHGLSSSQLFTAARDLLATQYLTFNNTHNHINNNLGNAMMRQAGYPYNGMSQDGQFPGTAMLAEMSNANNVNNNVSCWSELSHLKPGLQSILEGVRTLYAASETNSGCGVGGAGDAQSDNNSDTPAADYVKKKLAETSVRSATSLPDTSKPKQSMHNGATSSSSDNCREETSASNTNAGKHGVDSKDTGKESTSTVKLNCFQVNNSGSSNSLAAPGAKDCPTSDTKTLQPKKATECQPILNFHSSTPTGSDNERLLNPSQSMDNCVYSQSRSSVNSHSPDASSDKNPRRGDESSQALNPCTKSSSSETLDSRGHLYSNGPLANNPCEHQVISSERQTASCDVSLPCDSPASPCDSPASPCDASLTSVNPCNSSPSCDRPTTPMPSTSSFSPDSSTLVSGSSQSSSTPSINNHSDYVGYALKQWTVYLGNVLLNFIHKECRGQQHSTCAAAAQSSSTSSPGFCPCCHYHNQMASSAGSQQSSSQGFLPNTLHQGYYNYAASFSPFLHQHVQGKDPSVDFTQDLVEESEDERGFDEMSDSVPPIELPAAELSRLEEISELVSSCLPSPIRREKLAVAIENDTYIKKLLNIFHICEDLENSEGLHHLYEIFKNIFLLNKNALFEMMFAEDTIFDVVGCLEYEPGVARPKGHRQYLKSMARFHQVIPITNTELLSKIHQTYRVQYIQDVVLPTPSVFEENMLSTLSSFIFFNKVEIVSLIQEDEKFLTDLFNQLREPQTPEDRRKELVLFLKEFCQFSQTLQPQSRESFYKTLSSLGVLPALEMTLQSAVKETKAASVDILLFIVDFSPSLVREYMMHQINNTDDDGLLLMNIVIEGMICDTDPDMGAAVQLMGIIRTLLDPENMLASVNKSEKTDFLNHFYKHCMHVFIAPLLSNTVADAPEKSDSCTVQLLGLILELLSFCVEHHTYHIKNYILHKDLLRKILVLIKSRHTFLKLCAVRFMRKIIALKDEFYNRYIIKGNLFGPVIDALISNNGRYNLLDSAILEMFEFIKIEDIKSLCTHVVENFSTTLEGVTYVQTFKALKLRYDQHQDRLRDRPQIEPVGSILRGGPSANRFRRDPRQMDEDEELWFNDEEDFDEDGGSAVPVGVATPPEIIAVAHDATNGVSVSPTQSGTHSPTKSDIPSIGRIMEEDKKRELGGGPAATRSVSPGSTAAPPTSPNQATKKLGGLVDYEADSDEEEESSDEDLPPSKRLKTAT